MLTVIKPLDPCAPPDLRHLRRLTDDVGILQHTAREQPLPEFGYALDDVARALIVVTETARLFKEIDDPESSDRRTLADLADIYLRFIEFSQLPDGRFHNFVGVDRAFRDEAGSVDSFGRTCWALGVTTVRGLTLSLRERAAAALLRARPHVHDLPHLRSKAFTLLGLLAVLETGDPLSVGGDGAQELLLDLLHAFEDAATDDWPWFEDGLRYSNGVLPYALLTAARNSKLQAQSSGFTDEVQTVGLKSLDFLLRVLRVDGVPAPIGNRGWYHRGGERALYDQQCVDAAAMVAACAEAYRLSKAPRFRAAALTWWGWFFGENIQHRALYRPEDGATLDGLTPEGVNENRGAESVLVFLLAHLTLADTLCERRASQT